jgi:hypothetical protein
MPNRDGAHWRSTAFSRRLRRARELIEGMTKVGAWIAGFAMTTTLACQSDRTGFSPYTQGGVESGPTSNGTSASTESGDGNTESDASTDNGTTTSDDGPLLDVFSDTEATAESGDADECTNVDILFVIDDSGSMGDNQESLIASFDGFVHGIQQNLSEAESYHIGVVTSEDYFANARGCGEIGSLITQTGGPESSNAVCTPFTSGQRYLDETQGMTLTGKFACAAKVGAGGADDERMMRAMLNAVAPDAQLPGACNEGFSRVDSLLVIVLITDEDDVEENCDPNEYWYMPCGCQTCGSGGDKDAWYDELLAAKANVHENIVVLSLIGGSGNPCGAVINSKILGFTNLFGENGFKGDICAESYDQFFADALPVIDVACENYVPVG